MESHDTVKLLRECSSGITMAVDAIDEILESTKDDTLKKILQKSKTKHEELRKEADNYLKALHDEPKEPGVMAKGMSWMKTNFKMTANPGDETIADLITDGCNMGIKSLHRYLNQYQNADKDITKLAKDIIEEEEALRRDIRCYL